MNKRTLALVLTLLVVGGFSAWFSISSWNDASQLATIISALAAVAAVGVAVASVLIDRGGNKMLSIRKTGKATAESDGAANTGVNATRGALDQVDTVAAENTGDAASSTKGNANSGIQITE